MVSEQKWELNSFLFIIRFTSADQRRSKELSTNDATLDQLGWQQKACLAANSNPVHT
jgi:hypothetical protein